MSNGTTCIAKDEGSTVHIDDGPLPSFHRGGSEEETKKGWREDWRIEVDHGWRPSRYIQSIQAPETSLSLHTHTARVIIECQGTRARVYTSIMGVRTSFLVSR